MKKVYYAKVKGYKEWSFIYYRNDGIIVDDAGEEVSKNCIEEKYTCQEMFKALNTAIANTPNEDPILKEACKEFIDQAIEYFYVTTQC